MLDVFHIKRRKERLFGRTAPPAAASVMDAALIAASRCESELVATIVRAWRADGAAKAAKQADLIADVEGNAEAIRNYRRVVIHWSGWIEKGVDLMVSRRLKCRGVGWTTP